MSRRFTRMKRRSILWWKWNHLAEHPLREGKGCLLAKNSNLTRRGELSNLDRLRAGLFNDLPDQPWEESALSVLRAIGIDAAALRRIQS